MKTYLTQINNVAVTFTYNQKGELVMHPSGEKDYIIDLADINLPEDVVQAGMMASVHLTDNPDVGPLYGD